MKRILPTIALVVGIIVAFTVFIQDNAQRISTQNEEYIGELTLQRAISIDSLVSENLTFISSTAYLYGNSLTSPWADVAVIRDYEENSVFDMLRFVDESGDNYTSRGVQGNLADWEFYQAGMAGRSGVTYVLESPVTGQRQVGFYAPVRYEGQIIGVMVGYYGEEYVRKLLEYDLFGYEGEGWLCARDGTVLGTTLTDEPDDYFSYMAEERGCDTAELARIAEAFSAGQVSSFSYDEQGGWATAYAVPLTQADWVLVRNFPASASSQILSNANSEGVRLIIELIAMFALYGIVIGVGFFLDLRRTREASRNANDISAGVSTLFDAFVVLDLDAGDYAYIGGVPGDPNLMPEGRFERYAESLLARIPSSETEHRDEVARIVSLANLKESLTSAKSLSVRVHAPVGQAQWFTYSFIVIDRDGATPRRVLVVCQDATELYEKEQEEQQRLQQALDAAESASHAKTEFLFNMSHDLRTPMNAIIGYTELAQREGVTEAEMRDFISKIDASSLHLLALINDILEMSRIESGKITLVPEKADLVKIVDEAREMFEAQMQGKGISFSVDTGGVRDRWVLCDQNRLNRVILNLVSNAYKFTAEGGQVTVALSQGETSPEQADYTLRVKDTGIGMAPDFVTKLFSPFERERTSTVSKTQGTGLGLSITKNIVDLMGGTIEVQTEQGKGTEFIVRVTLPLEEPEEVEGDGAAPKPESVDFSGCRVLVVEDNAVNMEIASMILELAGFDLDKAVNGQEAVDKVAQSQPGRYDVVLMDVQMPVMDGYEATRAIRALPDARLACVPIVAMTANAFREDVQAALDAGMDGHVAKPIDVPKLLSTLAEVLRRPE